MTDTRTDTPSVAERVRPVKAEAPIVAAHFLGPSAVFVLGEEALLFATREGEARSVPMHGGCILASAADGDRVLTGGDDGKVMAVDANSESRIVATAPKRGGMHPLALGHGGRGAVLH